MIVVADSEGAAARLRAGALMSRDSRNCPVADMKAAR